MMPMINFQCVGCGEKFNELVNSHTKNDVVCPKCSSAVKQIYEGKCNSLASDVHDAGQPACCPGCSKGCPMQ